MYYLNGCKDDMKRCCENIIFSNYLQTKHGLNEKQHPNTVFPYFVAQIMRKSHNPGDLELHGALESV